VSVSKSLIPPLFVTLSGEATTPFRHTDPPFFLYRMVIVFGRLINTVGRLSGPPCRRGRPTALADRAARC
jgi:hypothetical protein